MRHALRIIVVLSGVLIALAWYFYQKDYAGYFTERKSTIKHVELENAGGDSVFMRTWLTLQSTSGLRVDCGMLIPRREGIFPAVIVLGGKATGKHAIDYATNIDSTAVVAVDYPYEPRDSYSFFGFLSDLPEMRAALIDMVPSVMLLIDYLSSRPDVDSARIVLLGYSFGAPLVPAIIAHDKRPAVAAMVYGGGDIQSLISHNVHRYEDIVTSEVVAGLGALLLHPIEPMRYARDITPIPLLMINGTDDEQIPRENTVLFFEAARQPKQIIWLSSGHVNRRDEQLNRRITGVLKKELHRMGILNPN